MTDLETQYNQLITPLRAAFQEGMTHDLAWRRGQLDALERLLEENEQSILDAMHRDFGKPPQEAFMAEVAFVISELRYARRRIERWSRRRPVDTPMVGQPGCSYVQPEPLGVVLIIGAWNYPVQLVLAPLIPALAAGNAAILKPSELTPHTSALIAELVPRYLDRKAVAVVEGGVPETSALLKLRFDHIFYTGGAAVGKIVMQAAAEHLTPVTLELGGKSPAIIDRDADLKSAARRLVWGKTLNAGQTCVAPDYVLISADQRDELIEHMRACLEDMFGADVIDSADYASIVNQRHFERLSGLLQHGRVAIGGRVDHERQRIEPTVLVDVDQDSELMQEEIFGPLLPVIEVPDLDRAIGYVRSGDKPLSAYLFTKSDASKQRFLSEITAGSACINDVIIFMSVPELPFGGVGMSGMGQYHGKAGFDLFSHLKSVMQRGRWPEVNVRFAPYSAFKMKLLKLLG